MHVYFSYMDKSWSSAEADVLSDKAVFAKPFKKNPHISVVSDKGRTEVWGLPSFSRVEH